jgi:hypothetical protein
LLRETAPMPRKTTTKKTTLAKKSAPKITKTAFVLSLGSIPAGEVIAKAKAAGMTISKAHVYAIRAEANAKAGKKRGAGRHKTTAAKKTTAPTSTKKVNKASFIMSFPVGVSPKEVAAAGKEKGITFSPNYVSRIRSLEKGRGTAPRRGPGRPPGKGGPGRRAGSRQVKTSNGAIGGDFERTLMGVVMALGLSKTRELVERAAEKLEAILR